MKTYKPKHSKAEYYDLIIQQEVTEIQKEEDGYHTFACVSQHVDGKSPEDCLDQIWDAVERRNKRIEGYKKLPTLEQLVNSKNKIIPTEMYHYKEKDNQNEDSCSGYSGDHVLRMREIGIDACKSEINSGFLDWCLGDNKENYIKAMLKYCDRNGYTNHVDVLY